MHATQQLAAGESYAGKLNDLEIAMVFDASADSFVGRVKNEANQGLCNTTIGIVLDGNRQAPQSVLIPALDFGGRADFTLDAGNARFTTWEIQTDTYTCTTVVSDAGESAGLVALDLHPSQHGSVTDEACAWVEPLCRIAQQWRTDDLSIREHFEPVQPDLEEEARAIELIRAQLVRSPVLVEAWQQYSRDKRTTPSPYLEGLEVRLRGVRCRT